MHVDPKNCQSVASLAARRVKKVVTVSALGVIKTIKQ